MRHPIRILAMCALAAAAADVFAAPDNPNHRGPNTSFYYESLQGMPRQGTTGIGSNPLSTNALKRPTMRLGPITPVPEPSTWALMLAGFGVVGFIMRRNSRR